MARAQGAYLDLVYVVDRNTPYVATHPEGSLATAVEQKIHAAERQGMELVLSLNAWLTRYPVSLRL